jgi:hypothetical protein
MEASVSATITVENLSYVETSLATTTVRGSDARPVLGTRDVVEFTIIDPDDPNKARMISVMLASLRDAAYPDSQKAANAMSLLAAVFPGRTDSLYGELRARYDMRRVNFVPLNEQTARESHNVIGINIVILMFFKAVGRDSWRPFVERRIEAMKSRIGETGVVPIPLTFDQAQPLGLILKSFVKTRKDILISMANTCYSQPSNPLTPAFRYLMSILKWTEMAAFMFIHITIVKTRSVILAHSAVKSEVGNLRYAHELVMSSGYPAFFRVMNPGVAGMVVERSKFPVLFGVAHKLMIRLQPSAANFVSGTAEQSPLVGELLRIHDSVSQRIMSRPTGDTDFFSITAADLQNIQLGLPDEGVREQTGAEEER